MNNTARSITGFLLLLSPLAAAPVKREVIPVSGWTVYVHHELLLHEPESTRHALELLKGQLDEIVRTLPAPATIELQKVPLYFSPTYPGVQPRAEYHPGRDWLEKNGRDPEMAKGVEFTNLAIFDAETDRMPNLALHELAHAFHDRAIPMGFANPEIRGAFETAKAGGKYDKVERRHGGNRPNTFEMAYAMTNASEYFAETTEAFFGKNDFFPFDQAELKRQDPAMLTLLEKLWGVPSN
jgi:hypothetical protein